MDKQLILTEDLLVTVIVSTHFAYPDLKENNSKSVDSFTILFIIIMAISSIVRHPVPWVVAKL